MSFLGLGGHSTIRQRSSAPAQLFPVPTDFFTPERSEPAQDVTKTLSQETRQIVDFANM